MTSSSAVSRAGADETSTGVALSVDFLATLGNVVQLAGLFISIIAGVTAMKRSSTALDEAEDRIMRLQQEIAEVDLQVKRAKRSH